MRYKLCSRCGTLKRGSEFGRASAKADGKNPWCKGCCTVYRSEWRRANPAKAKAARRRCALAVYGVDQEWYDAKVVEQGNCCAICGGPPTEPTWSIDHDHRCCPGYPTCGRCNRGLTHSTCNMAIGALGDDPNVLMAAAAYLIQHEGVFSGNAS